VSDYRATVCSFVPTIIKERALLGPDTLNSAGSKEHVAGVLFADISGFTALTETLSRRGDEGAEELTRLLNRYFGIVIDTIELAGGDILKFAGDALLAIWPCSNGESDLPGVVAKLVDVSRLMQQQLHDFEVAPDIHLSMKLAVGAGAIRVAHLGGVFDRWEFVVSGKPLAQLGRANDAAEPGQIVVAEEAAALLPERYKIELAAPGVFRFEHASTAPMSLSGGQPDALPDLEQTEQLLTFLPAAIRQRVAAGYADWLCELRPVSIVFMNLPGFGVDTPLTVAQEAMRALQTSLYRYEGSINKISVDDKGASLIGVMGLPPLSHVDDAERAIRAAIDMREGLDAMGLGSSIGVCTGTAFCGVVGNNQRREYTVMGDVVNLSARLMQAAKGGLLCDDKTFRQCSSRLEFEKLEPLRVKGKAEPIDVAIPFLRDANAATTQFVAVLQGRAEERERLSSALAKLLDGTCERMPRLCVSADGGLGKWALVAEMLGYASSVDTAVLVAAGDPLDTLTPLRAWRAPITSMLALGKGQRAQDTDPEAILERMPTRHARDYAALLNEMIPTALPPTDATRKLEGEQRREHLLELVCELVLSHVQLGPTVLAVKDAHLLDASSWELLARIGAGAPGLLIVATLRRDAKLMSEVGDSWLNSERNEHLLLDKLTDEAIFALARQKLRARTLAPELSALLSSRCDGNPLFCEELIAAIVASDGVELRDDMAYLRGGDSENASRYPTSLQGLVSSHIDRLEARAQLTLKVASVVGQLFSVQFVAAVHPGIARAQDVSEDVRYLVKQDLLARVPFGARAELGAGPYYQFKTAATRDVAYELMLYSQRRGLHRSIAEWIEANAADELPQHFATLGRHWSLAAKGRNPDLLALDRAAHFLERAGDRAVTGFANLEAQALFKSALQRIAEMPDSQARDQRELKVLLKRGGALVTTSSFADDEVGLVYEIARKLGEQTGQHGALFVAIRGLWQGAVGNSDYEQAGRLSQQLVELAGVASDPAMALEAHRARGNSAFWPGQFRTAREHMHKAVAIASKQPDAALPEGFSQDPDIANRGLLAWTLASLGEPVSAGRQIDAALERAQTLNHPFSMAYAVGSSMWTYFVLRDVVKSVRYAKQMVEVSHEYGFPYFEVAGNVVSAWARAETAADEASAKQAVVTLQGHVDAWQQASGGIGIALFMYALAEAQLRAGDAEGAQATLAAPLLVERLKVEQWYLSDVLRTRAECHWRLGNVREALSCARAARTTGLEQGARLPLLRLACLEATAWSDDTHWAALATALSALPENHDAGTIAVARHLVRANFSEL
jgi:class 3 adenylate cyclase